MAHVLPDEILKYEEWGLPIFPYEENKHPAFAGWQELAVKRRQRNMSFFLLLSLPRHQVSSSHSHSECPRRSP